MKLTDKTKTILENFASINTSLWVLAGTKQKTMNTTRTLLADAVIEEDFPSEFGIYDLQKFLALASLFSDPELTFSTNSVVFSQDNNKATFTFCEQKLIKSPPKNKDLTLGNVLVSFQLTSDVLAKLQKAARVLSNKDLVLEGDSENLYLTVKDNKNSSADTFVEIVGETTESFIYSFDIDSIKFIPGTYDVQIDDKKIARFSSKDIDLVYWVPTQKA